MTGRHSSTHHVSSFSASPNTVHRHTPRSSTQASPSARITRGSVQHAAASSTSLSQQDVDVQGFPIDPNLGRASAAPHNSSSQNAAVGLASSSTQPLPPFQHSYDTRPQSSGGDPRTHYNSYPADYHQQHQTPQTDYGGYDTSFGTDDQGTPTSNTVLPAQSQGQQPTSGASAAGPNTDPESQEIRRLAFAALAESIEDLANRTRAEENGSNGEKARQMFGMSWLMRNCEVSAGATPRNRVYARYVSLCATERLKPLNPASFGKLVRAVYPDIKTRRLGVRGQSKYHYCGIKLRDDDPNAATPDILADVDDGIQYFQKLNDLTD
jgi:RFX DNA-binding domain